MNSINSVNIVNSVNIANSINSVNSALHDATSIADGIFVFYKQVLYCPVLKMHLNGESKC